MRPAPLLHRPDSCWLAGRTGTPGRWQQMQRSTCACCTATRWVAAAAQTTPLLAMELKTPHTQDFTFPGAHHEPRLGPGAFLDLLQHLYRKTAGAELECELHGQPCRAGRLHAPSRSMTQALPRRQAAAADHPDGGSKAGAPDAAAEPACRGQGVRCRGQPRVRRQVPASLVCMHCRAQRPMSGAMSWPRSQVLGLHCPIRPSHSMLPSAQPPVCWPHT